MGPGLARPRAAFTFLLEGGLPSGPSLSLSLWTSVPLLVLLSPTSPSPPPWPWWSPSLPSLSCLSPCLLSLRLSKLRAAPTSPHSSGSGSRRFLPGQCWTQLMILLIFTVSTGDQPATPAALPRCPRGPWVPLPPLATTPLLPSVPGPLCSVLSAYWPSNAKS